MSVDLFETFTMGQSTYTVSIDFFGFFPSETVVLYSRSNNSGHTSCTSSSVGNGFLFLLTQ